MKQNTKIAVVFAFTTIFILWLNFGPKGTFTASLTDMEGTELLNPLTDTDYWGKGIWSSHNDYPTSAKVDYTPTGVTLSQKGEALGFYAVSIAHGGGPSVLKWTRDIFFNVSLEKQLIVSYTGIINGAVADPPLGWVAQGLDFWFDVKLPDGTLAPFELFIHFYENGIWSLPVGTFNTFGVRQDYDYNKMSMGTPWLYTYFHASQDEIGVETTHRFSLNEYVEIVKARVPEFKNGEFFLMRIETPMEILFGEGSFTVKKLSLQQVT